jgi:NADH:ubiquinone oxidoreductase subunit E
VDAAMELTAAEQRQAKRERLRSEHEKTQLQLMRLLDQIREVRTHSPRAHLAELALTADRARRTPRPISSII